MHPPHARHSPLGLSHRQLIAIIALIYAFVATYLHLWKIGKSGALACGGSGGCAVVQFSQWGRFLGVDVALIGAIGYALILGTAIIGSTSAHEDARGPRPQKRDPFKPLIATHLGTYPLRSAIRPLAECQAAGYQGSVSQLRDFVARIRPRPEPEPIVRFETPPGHQARFDFAFQPSVQREQIDALHTLSFIPRKENVVFLRPPSVGKTHLAISLDVAAAGSGRRVYYVTLADLIAPLECATLSGERVPSIPVLTRAPMEASTSTRTSLEGGHSYECQFGRL